MENLEELKRQVDIKAGSGRIVESLIGLEVSIIDTDLRGKVIGQSKDVWIVELSNGSTATYKLSELKAI